jgi:PIN domain nuclease of toxin-antitoxin system
VLLDTHAFLWFVLNDPRLSSRARTLICVFLQRELALNKINLLDISVAHTALTATLPFHHKDPFARMLVAQAMTEQIPLVSQDARLDAYAITRFW